MKRAILVAALLLISACSEQVEDILTEGIVIETKNDLWGYTNSRVLDYGNIKLYAVHQKSSYFQLSIGNPESFIELTRPLYIFLPNGGMLNLADENIFNEITRIVSTPFQTLSGGNNYWDLTLEESMSWPNNTDIYGIPPFEFLFNESQLIGFVATQQLTNPPQTSVVLRPGISDEPQTRYEFPLTPEAIFKVFGKPTRVIDTFIE